MRILLLAIQLALAGCATALHKEPEASVRLQILSETPQGTPLVDVRKVAQRYNTGCVGGIHEQGISQDRSLLPIDPTEARYYLRVCAGSGWEFPFHAYTFVTWYFDQDGRLLDVRVRREADAI